MVSAEEIRLLRLRNLFMEQLSGSGGNRLVGSRPMPERGLGLSADAAEGVPVKSGLPDQLTCNHDWQPTFLGGDTYACKKCGKQIDMTEDFDGF